MYLAFFLSLFLAMLPNSAKPLPPQRGTAILKARAPDVQEDSRAFALLAKKLSDLILEDLHGILSGQSHVSLAISSACRFKGYHRLMAEAAIIGQYAFYRNKVPP